MKYLHITSWAMTALGILAVVVHMLLGLSPMWLLGGVLLTWAGIVKIIVVLIWTRIARMGTDGHIPEKSV